MRFTVIALAAAFVFLWSSGWVGLKFGLGYSGPFTFLAVRYLLVVAILLSLVLCFSRQWKLNRFDIGTHALIGLLSHGVFLAAGVAAMNFGVSAGMTSLVTAMQPVVTSLFAVCSVGGMASSERPGLFQWLGAVLGILAVYLAMAPDLGVAGSWLGYALLFISVAAIALATMIDRRATLSRRSNRLSSLPLLQIILIHAIIGLMFFSLLAWAFEDFVVTWSLEYSFTIVYMAIAVSICSYGILHLLLRHMSAVKVSSLIYLTPPVTMLLAWPVLGETVTRNTLMALLLGTVAVLMVIRGGTGNAIPLAKAAGQRKFSSIQNAKQLNPL